MRKNDQHHGAGPVPGTVYWNGLRELEVRGFLCLSGWTFWIVQFVADGPEPSPGFLDPWPLASHAGIWYGKPPGAEPAMLGVVAKCAE